MSEPVDPISVALMAGWVGVILLFSYGSTRHMLEREARRRREAWNEAARAAGLMSIVRSDRALEGRSGSLHVRLSQFDNSEVTGTRVEIWGEALPSDLQVDRGVAGEKDVEIGEQGFDDTVFVRGETALARALLDPETRRALQALTHDRLERTRRAAFWATGRLSKGVLRADVADLSTWRRWGGGRDAKGDYLQRPDGFAHLEGSEQLPEALQLILSLARRLEPPCDVARRLADNLSREPEGRARLLLLNTLLEQFPRHAATREALVAAGADPDARLRLRAGSMLGAEGRKVLLELAGGEGADDDVNAKAVTALGPHIDVEGLQGVLRHALLVRKKATASACLAALGRVRGPGAIATLAKVLAIEQGELASKAASALGATGDPAAEAPLLAALADAAPDTRVAAASALGRVGTSGAVPALKEAEADLNDLLRYAARQAIAEIHSRLTGASPGQLSLATGEAGELSLTDDSEAGRLSLVTSATPPAKRS